MVQSSPAHARPPTLGPSSWSGTPPASFDAVRGGIYPSFANIRSSTRHGGNAVLTERQQEIWQFLVEYVDGHGYPPTVREIGERVGLASPSTVHAHLANRERAGLL